MRSLFTQYPQVQITSLRCAAARETRVQRAIAHGVAATQPGEETLHAEAVATVRGGAIPGIGISIFQMEQNG